MGVKRLLVASLMTVVMSGFALWSETLALTITSSKWYTLGTYEVIDADSITVGDSFGDYCDEHGEEECRDSCYHEWYGEDTSYEVDVAVAKYVFKAPFVVTLEDLSFEDEGFGRVGIMCLSPDAELEDFMSCGNHIPFKSLSGGDTGYIYIGRFPNKTKLCYQAGSSSKCNDEIPPDEPRTYEIKADANRKVRIYLVNEDGKTLLSEGKLGDCPSGWFALVVRTSSTVVRFEKPVKLQAAEYATVASLSLPTGTGHTAYVADSDEESNEYQRGYNDGFQAGIELCRKDPEACGIDINTEEEEENATTEYMRGFQAGIALCKEKPEVCGIVCKPSTCPEPPEPICPPCICPEPEPCPSCQCSSGGNSSRMCAVYNTVTGDINIPCIIVGDKKFGAELGYTGKTDSLGRPLYYLKGYNLSGW